MDNPAINGNAHVLFTGLGGSIGMAIHRRLRAADARITALSHLASPEEPVVVDFTDDDALTAAVARLPSPIDHIVLAHGMLETGPWSRVSPKAWRHMLDVNLNSIYAIL